MNHLKAMGPVIYLRVSLEELRSRIHNLDSRGIALEPGQTLEDILTIRAPLYERYADAVTDAAPGQTLAQTVLSVRKAQVRNEKKEDQHDISITGALCPNSGGIKGAGV